MVIFLSVIGVGLLVYAVWATVHLRRQAAEEERVIRALKAVRRGDDEAVLRLSQGGFHSIVVYAVSQIVRTMHGRLLEVLGEKKRLEIILENMVEAVLLLSPRKRVTLYNRRALDLFDVDEAQILGRHLLGITRNSELERVVNEVSENAESRRFTFQTTSPEERVLEVELVPVGEKDELTGVLLVIRDISDAHHVQKMQTDFVANVSHELQTPLTSIQGYAETLLDGAAREPETLDRFLNIIHRESERLSRLVDDLLDLSQIEAGKYELDKEAVDLNEFVLDVFDQLAPRAEEASIELENRLPPELDPLYADAHAFRQILVNLVDNAIKYTPEGGRVTVGIDEESDDDRFVFFVEDTGPGIPQKERGRVFERFYRVDRHRSRKEGGTGLGLSIVKNIVELHGWEIWVSEGTEGGARFNVAAAREE